MTSRGHWSRRDALAGLGLLASPRCAFAQPEPDAGAFLETAFDAARRVTVPVYLDHQGPFPFVVDTGANHSVVSAEVAAACSLPVSGTAMVHGIVSLQPAPEVKVAHIRVGSVTSAGLRLPAIPRAQLGCAGILGLDMLRNRRIVLGFRDQSFEIAPSSSRTSVGSGSNSRIASPYAPVTVPARYRNGQLVIIDAEACGQGITAFLDSGSQVTIANRALRDLAVGARAEVGAQIFHSMLVSATGTIRASTAWSSARMS